MLMEIMAFVSIDIEEKMVPVGGNAVDGKARCAGNPEKLLGIQRNIALWTGKHPLAGFCVEQGVAFGGNLGIAVRIFSADKKGCLDIEIRGKLALGVVAKKRYCMGTGQQSGNCRGKFIRNMLFHEGLLCVSIFAYHKLLLLKSQENILKKYKIY